jgi:hypothetical protein
VWELVTRRKPTGKKLPTSVRGKQGELRTIGKLLDYGFDVYTPVVDIKGIDCLVDVGNENYKEVQVKYRLGTPAFQVRNLTARNNMYVICCFRDEDWVIPSVDFRKFGRSGKDPRIVRLYIGKKGSKTYERLVSFKNAYDLLAKGATKEVKKAVELASKKLQGPHLTQVDYALAALDNLSIAPEGLTTREIKHKVWVSLYPRLSIVDKEILRSGRKRWETSLSYTLIWLKNTGLIEEMEKKRYTLTESGRAYLYNTPISWHIVPGHPAGPFGYTGTQAIRESAEKKLPPFDKGPSPSLATGLRAIDWSVLARKQTGTRSKSKYK